MASSSFNFEHRSCRIKRRYGSHAEARAYALLSRQHTGETILPYACQFCGGWHIGHPPKRAITVNLGALSQAQQEALPKATRWRAAQKGLVKLTNRLLSEEAFAEFFRPALEPEIQPVRAGWPPQNANYALYESLIAEVQEDCRVMAAWAFRPRIGHRGLPMPSFWDKEDLSQDLATYLLLLSGRDGFESRAWRRAVCRNRIRRIISVATRYDADASRRLSLELEER